MNTSWPPYGEGSRYGYYGGVETQTYTNWKSCGTNDKAANKWKYIREERTDKHSKKQQNNQNKYEVDLDETTLNQRTHRIVMQWTRYLSYTEFLEYSK